MWHLYLFGFPFIFLLTDKVRLVSHLGRWVDVAELQESSELLLFLPILGGLGEAREEVRADESGEAVLTSEVSEGEAK